MKFNLQAIKNKYFIDSDSQVFVGNAAEIRWLINTLEQQEQELITFNQSLAEDDVMIEQLQKELNQANERIKKLEIKQPVSNKPAYMDLDDE